MKKLFRLTVFGLLVGGWALAASAIHVVRTPSKFIVIPKDQIGYTDTYVDTRLWTVTDDSAHPAVVGRLIYLGKSDALAHTFNPKSGPLDVQLAAATAARPTTAPSDTATITDKARAEVRTVADAVKAKFN